MKYELKEVKIKKIKKSRYKVKTYDLKVRKNHNFFLKNGILSHNSGKSCGTMSMINEYQKAGYTVIICSNKSGNEFDYGFRNFPVKEPYHKSIIEECDQKPLTEEETKGSAILYHPFTFEMEKFYKKKMPPIEWFTFDLSDVSEAGFSSLMTGDLDKETVRVCVDTSRNLKEDESMYDFVRKVHDKIKASEEDLKYDYDPDNLFVPMKTKGDARTVASIRDSFKALRHHFFVQPKGFWMNLDFEQMLNDNKHLHVLCTRYINDKRLRYFIYLNWLEQINKVLESERVKHPVLLVIEEVKIILPAGAKTSYIKILISYIVELLSTIRAKGKGCTVISTTQDYYQTHRKFRSSVSQRILCKLSPEDKHNLQQKAGFRQSDLETISGLEVGEWIWMGESLKVLMVKYKFHMPPFAVPEERDNYEKLFKKYYPELMTNNTDIYRRMRDYRDNLEKELKDELKEREKKEKEKKKLDEKVKKQKEKEKIEKRVGEEKKKEVIANDDRKMELYVKAYQLRKGIGCEPKVWADIAKEIGVSIPTAQSYSLRGADIEEDEKFRENEYFNKK